MRSLLLIALLMNAVSNSLAAEPVPAPLVIRDATVFDSASKKMLPHRTILITEGRISGVFESIISFELPAGARVIEGAGKFVIPGLIDAHVHLVHLADRTFVTGDQFLPLFMAAGVTSVRSAGDAIVAESGVKNFAAAHPESCPRVFLASPLIDGANPYHRDVGYALTDKAKVVSFVAEMKTWGVTTLKIYVGTPREIGQEVVRAGHEQGLKVTGHLGNYSAQDAAADGIDCFEHIWSVFNYSIPAEVRSQPDHRANLDLRNPQCQDLIKLLAEKKVAVDATLVVFRDMIYLNDLDEVQQNPALQHVPQTMRRYWDDYKAKSNLQPGTRPVRQAEILKYQELTGMLHQAGVTILVGTDTPEPFVVPGFSMHEELEMLVQSGLSPAEAIYAATAQNAAMVNQADQLGSIEPGKLADLVILTADPTENIANIRKVETVIRGGNVAQPAEMLKLVPK